MTRTKTGFPKAGLAIAALAVVVAGAAHAHGPKAEAFAVLDANGDGQLSVEEMKAHAQKRFVKNDTDKDGYLSKEELMEGGMKKAGKRAKKMMRHWDENEDGKLSADEMAKSFEFRQERMFKHLDADGNGTISEAEYEKMKMRKGKHKKHSGSSDSDS